MSPSTTTATQEDLKSNRVPLSWRDGCSAKNNMYKSWECEHDRHVYEQCQYDDYVRRMKELSKRKLQAAEEAES